MSKAGAVWRQELRRSNAAVPHRNHYREARSGAGLHGAAIDEGVTDAGEPAKEDWFWED